MLYVNLNDKIIINIFYKERLFNFSCLTYLLFYMTLFTNVYHSVCYFFCRLKDYFNKDETYSYNEANLFNKISDNQFFLSS